MITILLIILILLVLAGFVILYFALSKPKLNSDKLMADLYEKSEEQRLRHKGEVDTSVKEMVVDNQRQIDRITQQIKEQLKYSQDDMKSLKEQNAVLREHLNQSLEVTKQLRDTTEGLRNLLSNNRLRGDWGEQVAEDLLLASGFVENINFVKQKTTSSEEGKSRPDFTLLLPDGTKLNIDAKFPFDDLVAYQEAKTETEKRTALKNFENAVKDKVRQITTRDYINPEEQTVDFVVMFIPNEMIFSFIYEKLPAMSDYCTQRKVVLTGPFGFTALIRLVLQAYKNFQYEKGLQSILGLIEKFQSEYEKFGEGMTKLGRQIETTRTTFGEIEGTRSRQLGRIVDKITEYSHHEEISTPQESSEQDIIQLGDKQ